MRPDAAQALDFALETARAAGAVIARHDAPVPGAAPRMKGLRDPVTEADLASERLIVSRIRERWPGTRICAEEEAHDAGWDGPTWYVDPLDGTVNFSQAHPFFAVSIALYEGPVPLAAVVHAPRLNETFAAAAGQGATLNGLALAVSRKTRLIDCVLATGFAYRLDELEDDNLGRFARLAKRVRGLRRAGSAALDLAYVAAARLDGHWEPHLSPWDVAAGALLVREAGGVVTTMDGGDGWLHGASLLACPPQLHAALVEALAAHGGEPAR
ncbi:MAG TPA: inositol monophosphatase family protein [Planctomycetota bacterium]|nr:inositol monophosphatase family protein [Planctomycetota bacterium]